ncbi:MAG TPA: hypothetical protein VGR89_15490 [Puia sp.]|nr:hypothetical protein [Puia sp.]
MRWLIVTSGLLAAGVVALAGHVYMVTHAQVDSRSRGMVRIDLHQPIGQADADRITAWLHRQKGVDHVLVSTRSAITVFTYSPLVANAGRIASAFRDSLPYSRAVRYLPSETEIKRSCPLRATPLTNAVYEFLKRVF